MTDLHIRNCEKNLQELDINKACGPYQMHPHLLKETENGLCKQLIIIMNKSLDMKQLPREWKKSKCFCIV